jgi:hypothetical protein
VYGGNQILRPIDDPKYVLVDLEFATNDRAEALLTVMRTVWAGSGGQVSSNQRADILENGAGKRVLAPTDLLSSTSSSFAAEQVYRPMGRVTFRSGVRLPPEGPVD